MITFILKELSEMICRFMVSQNKSTPCGALFTGDCVEYAKASKKLASYELDKNRPFLSSCRFIF